MATLRWVSLSVQFSNSISSLCVSVTFLWFLKNTEFFAYLSWRSLSVIFIITAVNVLWHRLFPISFLFFRPSHCLTHSTRPINNLIAASSVFKRKEELVTHLTLNQKVEMIKLSEEGMLKAGVGWKLGLLHQTAKLWMWTKRMWWKLKMLLWWIQEWEKSETALLLIRRKF